MKERPILFSAPMVLALLAGTKTQTRRVGKPVRHPDLGNLYDIGALVLEHEPQHVIDRACPYGQPGDRLWVREAWHTVDGENAFYRADYAADHAGDRAHGIKWKPSIHMPRSCSRILLEIVSVRVERLQEISGSDAIAEGIDLSTVTDYVFGYQEAYRDLWESINGPGSWAANPWVWCIEFRVMP